MSIQDRYASAVNARNLKSDPRSTMSDTDVLAAMGLASRSKPLATALARLLAGDNGEARGVVENLSKMIWAKAVKTPTQRLTKVEAQLIAEACLAWWRNGTCTHCGGLGKKIIPGTTTLSERDCQKCGGTGKIGFDKEFTKDKRDIARWAISQIDQALSDAYPEAKRKIA